MNGFGKTREQIAYSYGVCPRTLKKWLKAEMIELNPGLITPKKEMDIRNKLGDPKPVNTNGPMKNNSPLK